MRLIDADRLLMHLSDYALQESPWWGANGYGNNDAYEAIEECIKAVEEAPTVDAVEVTRCKDCKHYLRNKIYVIEGMPIMGNQVCEKWGDGCRTDENGFCFMGERRKVDGD